MSSVPGVETSVSTPGTVFLRVDFSIRVRAAAGSCTLTGYLARSRRTVAFFPLILTCFIAEITSLASGLGDLDDGKTIRDGDGPDVGAAQMGFVGDGSRPDPWGGPRRSARPRCRGGLLPPCCLSRPRHLRPLLPRPAFRIAPGPTSGISSSSSTAPLASWASFTAARGDIDDVEFLGIERR